MFKNPLVLAIIGGLVVLGAIVTNMIMWEDESVEDRTVQSEPTVPKPTIRSTPEVKSEPEQKLPTRRAANPDVVSPPQTDKPKVVVRPENTQPNTIEAPSSNASQGTPPLEQKLTPPSFDVVRITPDGSAVIAGRANPGSKVVIIDNGQFVGQLTTDKNGEWVFVPESPFAPGSRQLGLEMHIEGRDPILSDDIVMLVVPEPKKDIAGRKTDKPSAPLALKFPKKGGASTVLQKPSGEDGGSILSVDTVDYDEQGLLMISGRAEPKTTVFVYLDNEIKGKIEADENGAWRMQPENRVKPGLYTLRADQVNEAGQVQARISMPFSRADSMEEMPSEPFIIVQPGNSLWRIARNTYGSGFGFTTIYEANKDQIGDPDLIFPGQVFALPPNRL